MLYADWTNAGQEAVDLPENRGRYRLEMTILMRSKNSDVDPGDILKNFVLKLRSSDVNGQEKAGKESFVISIPLDQAGN